MSLEDATQPPGTDSCRAARSSADVTKPRRQVDVGLSQPQPHSTPPNTTRPSQLAEQLYPLHGSDAAGSCSEVGVTVGDAVRSAVGEMVGDGDSIGCVVGFRVGLAVGSAVGLAVGRALGDEVGDEVGCADSSGASEED